MTFNLRLAIVTFGLILGLYDTFAASELYEGSPCRRHDRRLGTCKPARECSWIVKEKIPTNLLARCSFHKREAIVCCGDEIPEEVQSNDLCETLIVDPVLRKICEKQFKPGARAQKACLKYLSRHPIRISQHVYGGEISEPGDYPHMVALGYRTPTGADFKCGGALVSKKWVLTAAHCLELQKPEFARLGSVDLLHLSHSAPGQVQDIEIERIIIHPAYTKGTWYHDIALLLLKQKIEPTGYVYPMCLNIHNEFPESGTPVSVIGWGDTEDEESETRVLLSVNLTVVGLTECDQKYRLLNDRKIRDGIKSGQLCAWDPELKRDACRGDSGGPLHARLDGINYIVGLVSFGHGCASNDPSVYTRVSHYIDWIEENVWPVNKDRRL